MHKVDELAHLVGTVDGQLKVNGHQKAVRGENADFGVDGEARHCELAFVDDDSAGLQRWNDIVEAGWRPSVSCRQGQVQRTASTVESGVILRLQLTQVICIIVNLIDNFFLNSCYVTLFTITTIFTFSKAMASIVVMKSLFVRRIIGLELVVTTNGVLVPVLFVPAAVLLHHLLVMLLKLNIVVVLVAPVRHSHDVLLRRRRRIDRNLPAAPS